jgi:hypothetical protein
VEPFLKALGYNKRLEVELKVEVFENPLLDLEVRAWRTHPEGEWRVEVREDYP